ncbi:hypothetical protein QGM71_19825 [Virgibacillus sp. C22-A2]|uniref:Uncharacterized protein n=1 Tax=Virgibacillus tibetensis TaxID=3042313 RepID=A0ABU6KK83_9BACI|nr:hypothetical protein [Virgibacillus sp. C22-A2]
MKLLLELVRIIVIFALLGGLAWYILEQVYSNNNAVKEYQWLGAVGIYMLLFVYYRNRLQFSGWYKGKNRTKLPKKTALGLFGLSVVFIALPFFLN